MDFPPRTSACSMMRAWVQPRVPTVPHPLRASRTPTAPRRAAPTAGYARAALAYAHTNATAGRARPPPSRAARAMTPARMAAASTGSAGSLDTAWIARNGAPAFRVDTPRIAGLSYPIWDELEARWKAQAKELGIDDD